MNEHRRYDFKNQHFAGEEGRLIPLLQRAQDIDGYVTRERIFEINKTIGIPVSQIYGVVTFYAQFRLAPIGKNLIRVCHGTACHVSGANEITQALENALQICNGETTPDRLFTLETVSCLGCCSLAPVIMINNSTYGNLTPKEVRKIIAQYQEQNGLTAAGEEAP